MGLSSRSGRAVTDVNNLVAFAVCDRCGCWENHDKLSWQCQWTGNDTVNLRILVCYLCLDELQEQLRSIVLPPDPVPTQDPRLENFAMDAVGGNLAGLSPFAVAASGGQAVTNWDTPGAVWDKQGGQWDLTVPE